MKIRPILALLILAIGAACSKQADSPAKTEQTEARTKPVMVEHTVLTISKSVADPVRSAMSRNHNPNKKRFPDHYLLEFELACLQGAATVVGMQGELIVSPKGGRQGPSSYRQLETIKLMFVESSLKDAPLAEIQAPSLSNMPYERIPFGFNGIKIVFAKGERLKLALAADLNLVDALEISGSITFVNATSSDGKVVVVSGSAKGDPVIVGTPRHY